jgi:hypothetical protein
MPLTLRRTRLETSPDAHLADYTVFEDGTAIGRIYEQRPPAPPDGVWTWSIFALGPGRGHVKAVGRSPTFEDAKAQLAASWQAFKAVGRDSDSKPKAST